MRAQFISINWAGQARPHPTTLARQMILILNHPTTQSHQMILTLNHPMMTIRKTQKTPMTGLVVGKVGRLSRRIAMP
jgi:hypothetical protein